MVISIEIAVQAKPAAYYLNASVMNQAGRQPEENLDYMDFHQPIVYDFPLPDYKFAGELINPWEIEIIPMHGIFGGKTTLKLTGRLFQALRFRRVP